MAERRSCVVGLALAAVVVVMAGCGPPAARRPVISGETMGTQYRVTFGDAALTDERVEALKAKVTQTLVAFNAVYSTYDPESEISRWNESRADEVTWNSDALVDTVSRSLEIARDTGGAFDPTVGPLVNRWQFGPNRHNLEPPSDAEVATIMASVGWEKVTCEENFDQNDTPERLDLIRRVAKSDDRVRLDLSAIAKGRGVDVICEMLEAEGLTSFLVDIGGELRSVGRKPDGSAWKVAVRNPAAPFDSGRQSKPAALVDAAMATSGNYFNHYEVDGVTYGHTIDPRTGRPVTHDLASVTVVSCDCEAADAYATTLMVLGPDEGYDWADNRDVAAMLIRADGSVRKTPAFENWIATEKVTCPHRS